MDFANISFLSPTAWLDLDAVDANIQVVNSKLNGKRLRLASKSVRCIEVLKHIQSQSPAYIGIMSYDATESQHLLTHGFDDVLCAYPQINTQAITNCEQALKEGQKMTWMVDKPEHAHLLSEVGRTLGKPIRLCIDLNMSSKFPAIYFGTQRSHIDNINKLSTFLNAIEGTPNIKIVGLMGYEAQIAGLPESARGKEKLAPAIRLLKSRSKKHVAKFRGKAAKLLQKRGISLEYVNGGGSGSLDFTCTQPEITEITVGSGYYMPAYFSYMDTMTPFTPAAGFALPVTRAPFTQGTHHVVTAHSGGFVASGAAGVDKLPVIHHPKGAVFLKDEGFGEVQTPLKLSGNAALTIGDTVFVRHAKAGELCEHFNELHVFRGSEQVATWQTYRGQGKCFH